MEPISAGIGVASFAFSLFATCVKGFLLLSSAQNLGKDASTLRCMLHLEEYRLVQWGEKSGLLRSGSVLHSQNQSAGGRKKGGNGSGNGEGIMGDGVEGRLNERLNRGLIEETLSELATLLTDVEVLKKKYNLELSTEKPLNCKNNQRNDTNESSDTGLPASRGSGVFGQAVSWKKKRMILASAKLISNLSDMPRKMWWVLADKDDFERLIRQIGFFVQRLVDLLDDQQQEMMRNDIRLLLLNVVALNDRLDELKAIQSSVEVVVGQDSPIASSAAVKHLRMELEDEAPPPYLYPGSYGGPGGIGGTSPPPYSTSPGGGSSLKFETNARPKSPGLPLSYRRLHPLPTINPSLITNKSGEGPRPARETAIYDSTELIYIEWKNINKKLRSKIRPRVENLAHLLHAPKHPSFRTLHCRGFFEDFEKGQYGFVFDRPPNCDSNKYPVSLLQMFRLKGFLPSQTQRIRLAKILATALSQLHSAGWLHKSLRADNILFFPSVSKESTSGKYGINLDEPYLVGYEYARFDSTSEVSEQPSSNPEHDIYRHPLAIGDYSESFNRLFDIYSLGLIFLEIALWRPLRKIVSKVVPELAAVSSTTGSTGRSSKLNKKVQQGSSMMASGGSPPPHVPLTQIMKIKEWLLDPTTEENIPQNLEFLMGEIYKEVVMRCLRGDLVGTDSGEGDEIVGGCGDEGVSMVADNGGVVEGGAGAGDGSDLLELEGARVSEGFFVRVVRELERCVI